MNMIPVSLSIHIIGLLDEALYNSARYVPTVEHDWCVCGIR
jgi:hypothetical protein